MDIISGYSNGCSFRGRTASMHEISDNAESLAELATELNAVVEKFKV